MPNPVPDLQIRAANPNDAEALAAMQNLPGFRHGTLRLPNPSIADLTDHAGCRRHSGSIGMGVHDAWTSRGVGHARLAQIIDHADNWLGLQRLELSVYTNNTPAPAPALALALAQSFNFQIEDTQRATALRQGRYVDAHIMARFHHLALD